MAVNGTQLVTYNSNLAFTTSTTAGTSGVIVYGVSAAGVNAGITNAPPAGSYYTGVTHFHNVAGKDGLFIGQSGSEIPVFDKQATQTYTSGSVSAGTAVICVAPFQCTVSGYFTQITAPPAVPAAVTVTNTAGTILLTYTPASAGNAYDTYNFALGTAGSTVVNGGQVLLWNMAATGTAYNQIVTLVLTRVGI